MKRADPATAHDVIERVTHCQGCDSTALALVMDFGHQPPVHSLLRREDLDRTEATYPVQLVRCRSCGLVQLGHVLDPRLVFPPSYPYLTGLTPIALRNFRDMARRAHERLRLRPTDLVVDIGSNDGTLLSTFRDVGVRVLGVEPTNVAQIANERSIPTVNSFFDADVARDLAAEHGKARVVTATNVIAHIAAISSVLRGIRSLLADDGVFISESHYLVGLLEQLQYDTIYHEHLRYYSVRPFAGMLERHGLRVVDVQPIPTHGGSIRVWAVADRNAAPARSVGAMIEDEERRGLYRDEAYERFRARVVGATQRLMHLLLELKLAGKRIAGVGGPARANMLLNYCGIGPDILDYIREQQGSLKVGLYMPGNHIPVVDEPRFLADQPEYALVLSWHIADEVMQQVRSAGYRGSFILPLPEPRIVARS